MDKRDLFYCCRTGDLKRIRYLVEEKDVDVNARDRWGGTPLYYACLCGHYPVVEYLLLHDAQCDPNTFDGERCLYGALTDNIRQLLQNFKVIFPSLVRRVKYTEFLRRTFDVPEYSDIQFIIDTKKIFVHRSILALRSSYIHDLLHTVWKDMTTIDLTELNIPLRIFKNFVEYIYTGQASVVKKDAKYISQLAEHFHMFSLIYEINGALKSKKDIKVIFILQDPLPQQNLKCFFLSTLPKELQSENVIEPLEPSFVDLHIKVDEYIFLCHKVFVCGRCSFLKALAADHFDESSVSEDSEIQVITLHDIVPKTFVKILEYIYTEKAEILPEDVLDVLSLADLFILPGLKKICASVIQENLSLDNVIPVIKLVRLYDLPRLENQCTEFMAENLEEIINEPEFTELILQDAKQIKNRQEVDTILVIDDIRYHIDKSERVSNIFEKHLLIKELLEKLELGA